MEAKTEPQMCIMLVEDDEILSREIMVFLRKWGYRALPVKEFDRIVAEFAAFGVIGCIKRADSLYQQQGRRCG